MDELPDPNLPHSLALIRQRSSSDNTTPSHPRRAAKIVCFSLDYSP